MPVGKSSFSGGMWEKFLGKACFAVLPKPHLTSQWVCPDQSLLCHFSDPSFHSKLLWNSFSWAFLEFDLGTGLDPCLVRPKGYTIWGLSLRKNAMLRIQHYAQGRIYSNKKRDHNKLLKAQEWNPFFLGSYCQFAGNAYIELLPTPPTMPPPAHTAPRNPYLSPRVHQLHNKSAFAWRDDWLEVTQ